MRHSIGVFRGEAEKVSVWFAPGASDYVKEKVWHDSQQIRDQEDGSIVFSADIAIAKELRCWIMHGGPAAVVLEPEELRDEIQTEAVEMLAGYANGVGQLKKVFRWARVGPRYYPEIKRKEIQLQVFLGSISLFLESKSTI